MKEEKNVIGILRNEAILPFRSAGRVFCHPGELDFWFKRRKNENDSRTVVTTMTKKGRKIAQQQVSYAQNFLSLDDFARYKADRKSGCS